MVKCIIDIKKRPSTLFIFLCVLFQICSGQISATPTPKKDSTVKTKMVARTRRSIMDVVNQNCRKLKAIYDERLKIVPTIEGEIKMQFAINEFGKVIYCRVDESNVQDTILEIKIKENIMNWTFAKIDNPGDITQIIYPFVFKRNNTAVVFFAILLFAILSTPLFVISHQNK